jgi:hypothetical protein
LFVDFTIDSENDEMKLSDKINLEKYLKLLIYFFLSENKNIFQFLDEKNENNITFYIQNNFIYLSEMVEVKVNTKDVEFNKFNSFLKVIIFELIISRYIIA